MTEEPEDFEESEKFNKWWNPLTWSPWIKYSLGIWVVAMLAWNSTSPASIITTAIVLWMILVGPKLFTNYLDKFKTTNNIRKEIEDSRKKAEQSNLTVREEQIFKQLTDNLFDK